MAVASMDHRGIDAVLKSKHFVFGKPPPPTPAPPSPWERVHKVIVDMLQHPGTVVSAVLVMFVAIRLLLHCRHEEGDKSWCRDCYCSILRGIAMRMRAQI